MTYSSTNLRLTYDNNTNQWSYTEADYEYANPTPPTWSGYTSSDPDFEFAPEVPDTNQPPSEDPCPAGYIYDNTLKQCVPDPNAQTPFVQQQGGGGGGPDRPDNSVYIPPNSTKENWIENANKIIPAGQEGAGKTGLAEKTVGTDCENNIRNSIAYAPIINWLDDVNSLTEDLPLILLGNKCDLVEKR